MKDVKYLDYRAEVFRHLGKPPVGGWVTDCIRSSYELGLSAEVGAQSVICDTEFVKTMEELA